MHSSNNRTKNMSNNNFKYTNATIMDNGYHYFPDEHVQTPRQFKKHLISEMKIRNKNKITVPTEVKQAHSLLYWPANETGRERQPHQIFYQVQQHSVQPLQNKSRQLLPIVHMPSVNKTTKVQKIAHNDRPTVNINSNNNNQIDRELLQVFPLEVQPVQLTPSVSPKHLRGKKFSDPTSYPVEQHYQHYYSYYYDRQSNFQERKVRKLPDTRAMATARKNSEDLVSRHQFAQVHEAHVLREKINNNILGCDDEDTWRIYQNGDNKYANGDDLNQKEYDANAVVYSDTSRYVGAVGVTELQVHRHEKKKTQEESGSAITQRHAKLPPTPPPNRSKNPENVIKKLPSPRPRVLLYNQSPRMGRATAHAYAGVRLQEWRRSHHTKSPAINASEKIKKRYKGGLVQTSRTMNTDCYVTGEVRSSSPVTVGRRFTLGAKPDTQDNEVSSIDDEVDDDLDNVSDFESDISGSSSDEDGYRLHAYKQQSYAMDKMPHSYGSMSPISVSDSSSDVLTNPKSLLVPSLFPNVPPYLSFSSNTSKGPSVPPELYRILKWRISNVMPKVVRHILANSGMRLLKKTNDWMGVWGKHLKSPCFRTIRPYQKINHLPGSFKIGRKDSLWKSLLKHSIKHGRKDFGFMPKTYIIPNDLKALRKAWPKYASRNVKWIIKPPASARGAGIRVVSKWAQIPKRRPLIVQRYIERPLLINGSKFDLRLYVLVTSMNPLRVYLYHNGLARFASVKYSDRTDTLHDRCMHLTNYSINKLSSNYAKNEDVNACHGHKWTIKSLWNYLSSRGVRTDYLWAALRALVLRTLLVGESTINNMIRMNVESKYSVYELFGFDILLDADLIPWLLEVNISPSLHSELPLDAHVKAPLVQAVLNTALYNIPPKLSMERQRDIAEKMSYHINGPICYDKRLYINYLSRVEKVKHNTYTRKTLEDREEYLNSILEQLTPDDVRCLVVAEDELSRCAPLERIFPTIDSHKYLKYYDTPRYYNRLLDAWETRYANNRQAGIGLLTAFCMNRYHLQVPQAPVKKHVTYRTQALRMTTAKYIRILRKKKLTPNNSWRCLRIPSRLSSSETSSDLSEEDEKSNI